MHDGSNTEESPWGAIGCIEFVGTVDAQTGKFENFNWLMRKLSGTKKPKEEAYHEITRHELITLRVDPAETPALVRLP